MGKKRRTKDKTKKWQIQKLLGNTETAKQGPRLMDKWMIADEPITTLCGQKSFILQFILKQWWWWEGGEQLKKCHL